MTAIDKLLKRTSVVFYAQDEGFSAQDDEDNKEGNRELIVLDASVSETHVSTSKATRNPIEDGSDITDHVILDPDSLSIEGIVSDTPLSLKAAAVGIVAGIPSTIIGGTAGAVGTALTSFIGNRLISGSSRRSKTAYKSLVDAQKNRTPLTIITGLQQYKNMILENLTVPRNSQNSKSLRFTATLINIVIVKSEATFIPKSALKDAVKKRAQAKVKQGSKQTKDASDKVNEKSGSILSKLLL